MQRLGQGDAAQGESELWSLVPRRPMRCAGKLSWVSVRDASVVVAGARFRLPAGPGGRITADAAGLASDFAGVPVSPRPPTVGAPLRQARLRARSS